MLSAGALAALASFFGRDNALARAVAAGSAAAVTSAKLWAVPWFSLAPIRPVGF